MRDYRMPDMYGVKRPPENAYPHLGGYLILVFNDYQPQIYSIFT